MEQTDTILEALGHPVDEGPDAGQPAPHGQPNNEDLTTATHLSQSQHAAERARNQEKLQWTLQRKRDDIIQRASGHNLNLKLREPEELAKEVEEALHSQLSGNSYSEQFRVVWCCLNDTQNNVCGFKLLMGTMRPESLPSLTIMELQAPIPNDV